jgi:predicted short-subunit dehydrogenase-like oxidoreductase (DUF2520 family)
LPLQSQEEKKKIEEVKLDIVFIGSGNVAWHLAQAMDLVGHHIIQVISRSDENAMALAMKLGARHTDDLSKTIVNADLYVLCVPDDNIQDVVRDLPELNAGLVHTSGPKSMDILSPKSKDIGIFYPLQTFSKHKEVDMFNVPIMLEASGNAFYAKLFDLADSISNTVLHVTLEDRVKYHLAAVFANNFANHLFYEASSYLKSNNLDFSVLKPLILETAAKIIDLDPEKAQTGPARRGDSETIHKHLELLNNHPRLKELYEALSKGIQAQITDE